MSNSTSPSVPKPKRKSVWIILSIVGFAIIMAIQQDHLKEKVAEARAQEQAQKDLYMTVVWIPNPVDGGMMPYMDAEVLEKETSFVKFRASNGNIIEQHGIFKIENRKRDN
jgi:hypothetical protein